MQLLTLSLPRINQKVKFELEWNLDLSVKPCHLPISPKVIQDDAAKFDKYTRDSAWGWRLLINQKHGEE